MKEEQNTRRTVRCANCLFGRTVTITDKAKDGSVWATRETCKCHVARPTRYGFPTVQLDDFCSCHVDAQTLECTFAGLVAPSATATATAIEVHP